eukprot:scaffold11578_cov20-Tisochrysis_lutea.AAC.3
MPLVPVAAGCEHLQICENDSMNPQMSMRHNDGMTAQTSSNGRKCARSVGGAEGAPPATQCVSPRNKGGVLWSSGASLAVSSCECHA